MTPTSSSIINFTLKGVLHRLHKLSYLSFCKASDDIVFPRVQRKNLQLNEDTENTFKLPTLQDILDCVENSKADTINVAKLCGISLTDYNILENSFWK